MKRTNTILLTAVAFIFTLATQAMAHDRILSPRAQANETRIVSGITTDVNLAATRPALGRAKIESLQHSTVPAGAASGVNLAHQPRPLYTGKNPARELRGSAFEVAPLGKARQ